MIKKATYSLDMTHGAIMPKLITFFIPLMISGALQLMFNAVDLIVVGNWAGSEALAAVGTTSALIGMFINLFMGVSMGANVVAARYIACDEKEKISATVHTSICVAITMGLVIMVFGILMAPTGLRLMDTPPDVMEQAVIYMRIYFCGMPFFMVYNYGAAILRASGDTKRPLYYLLFAGVINATMNMILVIFFHLGVAGVAFATIFSQMISCILVLQCLMKSRESYRLERKKLKIHADILKKIFAIGIPAGIQSTVISFSNVLLQSSVNSFGSIAMAGYTAANNLLGFHFTCIDAISQACMSFCSQNFAVRKMERVKKVIAECLILDVVVAFSLGGIVYLFGAQILGIYNSAPNVIMAGMKILNYTTLTYFICGFMNCLPGALRGLGYSTIPMILSVIGTVGTRIVWIYALFPHHRTLDFLFISYPASWLFTFALQSVCMVWVFRKIRDKNPF